MDKIPCIKCGALVMPATAERNNGLCAPCSSKVSVSPRKKAIVGIFVGSFFLIIGLGLGVWGHFGCKKLDHVKAQWTQVTGKVTSIKNEFSIANGSDRSFGIIKYSYTVDGSEYNSEYTHENSGKGNKGGQRRDRVFYEKHQIGNAVKIYFNPDKHDESLLEVEVLYSPLATRLAMGGMGLLSILGLCRIVISVMSLTRKKTS
jgi:DNA-directed RNA polymerase subunit RPC12/RpoP